MFTLALLGFAGIASAENAKAEVEATPVTTTVLSTLNSACCGVYGVNNFCSCNIPTSITVPATKVLTVVKKCKDTVVNKPKTEMVTQKSYQTHTKLVPEIKTVPVTVNL